MDIPYLITLLQNKLNYLGNARASSVAVGDLSGANTIDQEILATQNTLAQLNLLATISQAAQAANISPADVVANAVTNSQNQSPATGAIVDGYDISTYATDPQYQDKIKYILNSMPVLKDSVSIDGYIQNIAPGSPVTGFMVETATNAYGIDMPLLVAIMQNDSCFGTTGVGARTFNPGNVGNTGTEEHTYASWQDGVSAVAQWLSNHKVVNTPAVVAPIVIKNVAPDTSTSTQTDTSSAATSSASSTTPDTASSTTVTVPDTSTSTSTQTDTSSATVPDTASSTTVTAAKSKKKGFLA